MRTHRLFIVVFASTLGLLIGAVLSWKLVQVYYFDGEPITFASYIFSNGVAGHMAQVNDLSLGATVIATSRNSKAACMDDAKRILNRLDVEALSVNETIIGTKKHSRIAVRCIRNGKTVFAIVYGASFSKIELKSFIPYIVKSMN